MERFLVKMQDPIIAEPPEEDEPAPYSIEGLATNRPRTSLLDRIHRDEAEQEHKRQRVEERMQQIKQQAENAAAVEQAQENQPPPEPLEREEDGSVVPNITREFREKVMYVEDVESGVIPKRTFELCKWDMQPFTGVPFPIPVKYEARENKIFVVGYTCSVSCALAYIQKDALDVSAHTQRQLTIQLAKDYYGASYCEKLITPAPPREKLSMLYAKYAKDGVDNPMLRAVREFRDESDLIIYHPHPAPPFLRVTQRIDEEVIRRERQERHQQRLDLMNANPQPIATTTRGMHEQRKYVLAKKSGKGFKTRGIIGTLLNLQYKPVQGDSDDEESS